jgi:hypothetical protein
MAKNLLAACPPAAFNAARRAGDLRSEILPDEV